MSHTEVKTAELEGLALDWIVDGIESGTPLGIHHHKSGNGEWIFSHNGVPCPLGPRKFSTDQNQGGKLIDQYQIDTVFDPNGKPVVMGRLWVNQHMSTAFGPTRLIAAMRCLCAAKLGDTVQVPKELING